MVKFMSLKLGRSQLEVGYDNKIIEFVRKTTSEDSVILSGKITGVDSCTPVRFWKNDSTGSSTRIDLSANDDDEAIFRFVVAPADAVGTMAIVAFEGGTRHEYTEAWSEIPEDDPFEQTPECDDANFLDLLAIAIAARPI